MSRKFWIHNYHGSVFNFVELSVINQITRPNFAKRMKYAAQSRANASSSENNNNLCLYEDIMSGWIVNVTQKQKSNDFNPQSN